VSYLSYLAIKGAIADAYTTWDDSAALDEIDKVRRARVLDEVECVGFDPTRELFPTPLVTGVGSKDPPKVVL
jgi:hypothetical protein